VRLSLGLQFLLLYERTHAGGATGLSQVSGEIDSMRRKATLQTLPEQGATVVAAASADEPESRDVASERAAAEAPAATGDNATSDEVDDAASDGAPADCLIVSEQSLFSSLAAALRGDRSTFLQVLDRVVDGGVPPAARDAFSQQAGDASDESAAFEKIVAALVADRSPLTAVVVGSALAARTVAHALFQADNDFDTAAAEALLAAWLDAARALLKLRGAEGLLRLVPAARNLARRTAGRRDVAPAIADAMRRVVSRIGHAEHSLERTPRHLPQRREHERMRSGVFDLPRRIVIHGQMQLIFHPR
jgi:hypothetical protein